MDERGDLQGELERLSPGWKELRAELEQAITISSIAPMAALVLIRKGLQRIVQERFEHHFKEPAGTRPLENLLDRLVKEKHLATRLAAYARVVKDLGNVGAHDLDADVTADDVADALRNILPIVRWYTASAAPAQAAPSPALEIEQSYPYVARRFVAEDVDAISELPPLLTNGCGVDFLLIKGGRGNVGNPRYPSDGPPGEVHISPLYLSRNPITNRDFFLFVRRALGHVKDLAGCYGERFLQHWNGGRPQPNHMEHPVTFVSWKAAVVYCEWLQASFPVFATIDDARVEFKLRLPTEAEWEFAARGGLSEVTYPWGDAHPTKDLLNYCYHEGGTTECMKYAPNALGLHDMAGNVGEWCLDDYTPREIVGAAAENPCACTGSPVKIIKGGSWRSKVDLVRVSFRDKDHYLFCDEDVGFRVAAEVNVLR